MTNKLEILFIAICVAIVVYIPFMPHMAYGTTKQSGTSTDVDPWIFTLTDSANSDFFRMQGLYVCKLDDAGGGSWGSGTVTLQKLLFGSPSSGTYVNVQTAALVGATSDVAWTEFTAGTGYYKWVVTGGSSMSVTAHCGKAY